MTDNAATQLIDGVTAELSRLPESECPHCGTGGETFRFMRDLYIFDIDQARKIVADGRRSIELAPSQVTYSVDSSRIYRQHLLHVNPGHPGILAHYWYPEPDGAVLKAQVLIDGHHRAARCLESSQPFHVFMLNDAESRQVLISGPDDHDALALAAGEFAC